jgi:hypothetical protein
LELAERAGEKDYVVAKVLAGENMLDSILENLQKEGERYLQPRKSPVAKVDVGAYGFSFGLTFNEATERTFGFGVKLSMICDELAKRRKGILILVDEVQASGEQMRELAGAFQQLIGEGKDIAVAMAGLPGAISSVLNDDPLTFLNRANKTRLAQIADSEVGKYFYRAFRKVEKSIAPDVLETLVSATKGYPYLMQLIGFHALGYLGDDLVVDSTIAELAIRDAKQNLPDNVFRPSLRPLSKKDVEFLKALAKEGASGSTGSVTKRLKVSPAYTQQYRRRLKEADLINTEQRGWMRFTLPYLDEYLNGALTAP